MAGSLPFSGYSVVELVRGLGGAYCGKLLAELGAEVVKVEAPGGDPARRVSPLLPEPADFGALFLYANQRKRSVVLDVNKPEGVTTFGGLLGRADVLITDGSWTQRQRLALNPSQGAERWPSLVQVSIRGYGLTGPLAEVPATELDIFHSGGEGRLLPGGLGYQLFPDRPPVKAARHLPGYDSGVAAAALVAAALYRRELTGRGEFIDLSEQEVEISLNRMNLDAQLNAGMELSRAHRGYDFGGIFACRDGYVTVRPNEDRHWVGLARGLDREDLVKDPRFATRRGRQHNADPLNGILQDFFSRHTMLEIYERLGSHGTPVGYFADAQGIYESEQFQARGFFRAAQVHGTELLMPGPAYRMSETPPLPPAAAPLLGADTVAVLGAQDERGPALRSGPTGQSGRGLLSGVRIVDASWAAAGPYATEIAAMLGAEVIKVETSLRPDLFRRLVDSPDQGLDASSRFNALNMCKQGLRLNLQTAEGREVFRKLVAVSDACVENYRPGVVERLGISYRDLVQVRPDLVMVSVSAAGRGGPHQDHPGYASIFNAMAGLGHLTGYTDGPPTEVRDSVDLRVASVAAFALLAALLHRARTGRGQWIDLSAREAIASLIGDALVEYAATGISPARAGNRTGEAAPYGVFQAAGTDAWVAIAVTCDEQWVALCGAMGRPELAGDPRYATVQQRELHRPALEAAVQAWTRERPPRQVAGICRRAGVAASEVMGGREMLEDPHLTVRAVVQEVVHPMLGPQKVVRAPWILGSAEPQLSASPLLGEHTESILRDLLGYRADEIDRMRAAGAFE